jgi:secondary thiamine-phosphate synthase enzyme
MWRQVRVPVATQGRGFHELTELIEREVTRHGLAVGLCHVFLRHTSASLCVTENADPDVRADLERFAQRAVPDGDRLFVHDAEGPDDMSAHVRSLLMGCELTVPIAAGRLALGTWQGIYLWEHRTGNMQREVLLTLHGEPTSRTL